MRTNSGSYANRGIRRGANAASPMRGDDVVDAEFVHVDQSGDVVALPGSRNDPMRPPVAVQFPAAQASGQRRLGVFSGEISVAGSRNPLKTAGFASSFVVLVLGGFWFAGGHALAPMMLGSNASSLHLSEVTSRDIVGMEGQAVLVEGTISNPGGSVLEVPLVAIEAAGQRDGEAPLYVRAPKKQLAAGESTRFRVRVSQPVRGYRELTVSLAGGSTGR